MSRRTALSDLAGLTTVRTVGGLVPPDLLGRIVAATDLDGLTGDAYHLELGVSPREAANRAWSVLSGAWTAYRDALGTRPPGDRATGLTREKWLAVLLRELGFGRLIPTPAGGIAAADRSFPVSHSWGDVPIHLLGWGVDLDRRTPGLAGAAEKAPHAMVQELLNRSDGHLWAVLANGGTLRLLRDTSSIVGQAYVEFDLDAMFEGEVFSDFVVLYLLCHVSRFEPVDPDAGLQDCWLERWRADAVETGARALGELRRGVEQAIEVLGTGFLQHTSPTNMDLRRRLESGELELVDYHRAVLRLVYRLIFCFVAEDRDVLLVRSDDPATITARRRYVEWFSTRRLRRIATRRRGTRHSDLWEALSLVLEGLGGEHGRPELALPGLGGLFELGPADVMAGCQLQNDALLAAIRHLTVIQPPGGGPKRNVDYLHLGAEELGGIYESLLELIPRYDPGNRVFSLESLSGNERKKTGSYYTPRSLIDCLLDSALDPLLDAAEAADDPEDALLALTVCDPACGSGHFLVAAAQRIADRVARVRAEDAEPSVTDSAQAMHDVVERCIYGVDLNPLAAELAKVSLWLEGLRPGRPLSFLDGHIKVGNALLGTTPALLAAGVPDEAFKALPGDDKPTVTSLKRQNGKEQSGQDDLFSSAGIPVANQEFAEAIRTIDAVRGLSLADIHLAERRQRELERSPEMRHARLLADTWCAAFVIAKTADTPRLTHGTLMRWGQIDVDDLADDPTYREVQRIADRYRFFHWHLEFPRIFPVPAAGPAATDTGWHGGFDCVVGNPPWERIKLQEQEFFAARDPEIADAPNAAARKRMIKALATDPDHAWLHAEYTAAKREADGESHFVRNSGRYPLCGRGDINTYAIFAETDRNLVAPLGRMGIIVPTGIATDATTQYYFKDLVAKRSLVSLYDFENAKPLFPEVHRSFKFCLLTLAGSAGSTERVDFAFFAHDVPDLRRPDTRFYLATEEITLLNPNTGTCPIFRTRRDAEITLSIYRRVPLFVRHDDRNGNPWGVQFRSRLWHMAEDAGWFRTADVLERDGWTLVGNTFERGNERMLPLYEAKLAHQFNHRWGTYDEAGRVVNLVVDGHRDPEHMVRPHYWVPEQEVEARLGGLTTRRWLLGIRDIARSTDERTMIAAAVPRTAVGHKLPLLFPLRDPALLYASLVALPLDFVVRQKIGGTSMSYFIVEQLPVPSPSAFEPQAPWDQQVSIAEWISSRVLELTYTAWDMEPMARDLDDAGLPFVWDDARRAVLRAELDGAFFHLYGIGKDDVDYILGTFPIVHRNDLKKYGEERTRRLVLENYDRLATAIESAEPFVSTLDPPPGHGPRHPRTGGDA